LALNFNSLLLFFATFSNYSHLYLRSSLVGD
jgi:hypothetical protein